MELKDVQAWLETNKDKEEVKNYMQGLSKITLDGIENFASTDEGKKWLSKHNDSFFSKSLETWKKNNLDEEVAKLYKQKHPDADPKDTALKELQAKIEKMEQEGKRKELTNKALKVATEKKLPVDIIDYFIGDSEENTTQNLDKFAKVFETQVNALVEEKIKSGYKPPNGGSSTEVDISKMSMEEYAKYWEEKNK